MIRAVRCLIDHQSSLEFLIRLISFSPSWYIKLERRKQRVELEAFSVFVSPTFVHYDNAHLQTKVIVRAVASSFQETTN